MHWFLFCSYMLGLDTSHYLCLLDSLDQLSLFWNPFLSFPVWEGVPPTPCLHIPVPSHFSLGRSFSQYFCNFSGLNGLQLIHFCNSLPYLDLSHPLSVMIPHPTIIDWVHFRRVPNGWWGPSENYCVFPIITFISPADISTVLRLICLM